MPRPTPISEEQRADVLRRARAGESRNRIARETGVSASSVSRIAKAAGVTFDRVEQTELATASRAAAQRADRVDQAQGLLDDLAAGRARLDAAENTRQWFDIARGLQALAMAHGRLAEVEHRTAKPEDSAAAGRSMLGNLFTMLRSDYVDRHGHGPEDQDDDQEATP